MNLNIQLEEDYFSLKGMQYFGEAAGILGMVMGVEEKSSLIGIAGGCLYMAVRFGGDIMDKAKQADVELNKKYSTDISP